MTVIKMTIGQKIDNIDDQLDKMRSEAASFRSYTNNKFEEVIGTMVTKDDLYYMEERLVRAINKVAEKVGA